MPHTHNDDKCWVTMILCNKESRGYKHWMKQGVSFPKRILLITCHFLADNGTLRAHSCTNATAYNVLMQIFTNCNIQYE